MSFAFLPLKLLSVTLTVVDGCIFLLICVGRVEALTRPIYPSCLLFYIVFEMAQM